MAITQWLKERLKLEVSQEKTRFVNVQRRYSEFLGVKIKFYSKDKKQVVKSHVSDRQLENKKKILVKQVKRITYQKKKKEPIWRNLTLEFNGYGNAELIPNVVSQKLSDIWWMSQFTQSAMCNTKSQWTEAVKSRQNQLMKSSLNFYDNRYMLEALNTLTIESRYIRLKKYDTQLQERNSYGVEWGKLSDYFKELPITIYFRRKFVTRMLSESLV